ncbi:MULTISPECIES: SRPBCC family protein [unclassified Streptomyces]|uniref:SRPBCC family protein n=1 Tax=unclassified Streptomyces TaxID=2593676 RepID=UPI002E289207|nr:SRPBCC family protein [Streptomyces sp. NBC_01429]
MPNALRRSDSTAMPDAAEYTLTRTTWVHAGPAAVFELISDVSMISTWSPSAHDVAYDDGDGPWPGAHFRGRNRRGEREWSSRSQVVESLPGSVFAFVVDGIVRWRWTFRADGAGTVVEQSWQLLRLDPVLGSTRGDLDALRAHTVTSVEHTLLALARWTAEQGDLASP